LPVGTGFARVTTIAVAPSEPARITGTLSPWFEVMRRLLYLSLAALVPLAGCAANGQRTRTGGPGFGATPASTQPEEIIAPDVPLLAGLPHAVKIGFTVYVSAMVPLDSAGALVGRGDLAAQSRQVMKNLASVVQTARGVPGDVVRITIYLTNLTPAKVAVVRPIVLGALDPATPPALTIIGVDALPEPGMDVMVDATAQLRSAFPDRSRIGGSR
jgi:enamine deaminase RidA (YjgF/YER057c/UK114 family)